MSASADHRASHQPPADRPHFKHWPKRLPRHLVLPETSLWANLEVSAKRFPDKPLFLYFGREHSFSQVHADACALAGWLQSVGVKAGDRVLLCMQNCPQYAVAFYGILCANAVVVPVNPMNKADELRHYITDPEARVAIVSADVMAAVAEASASLPAAQQLQQMVVARYAEAMPAAELEPGDAGSSALQAWLHFDPPLAAGHNHPPTRTSRPATDPSRQTHPTG